MTPKELKERGIFIGKTIIFPEKSVQLLINNMVIGEELFLVTICIVDGNNGVFAVTNQRIIFSSVALFKTIFTDFEIRKITSVTLVTEFLTRVRIQVQSSFIEITSIQKEPAQLMVNKIKELQNNVNPNNTSPNITVTRPNDMADLEKLAELKMKGIITEEEFNLKKKQILGL